MTYGIVLASYEYGHLAAHAIESVICQTKKFDKIWFVDDAAGDCYDLPKVYPNYDINWVFRSENLGTVANFNDMLNRVDTDYVMFLGADNWLRPDTLRLLDLRAQMGYDIITYDIMVTGTLRQQIADAYSSQVRLEHGDYYWDRRGGHHGSMMYRTALAKQVGGYADNKTSSRTDEDLNLWDKMRNAGATVHHVQQALLYYRRHENNFNKY